MHGLIALVQNHVHMVAAHFSGRFDALPGFFDLDRGRRCTRKPAVRGSRQPRQHQQDDRLANCAERRTASGIANANVTFPFKGKDGMGMGLMVSND